MDQYEWKIVYIRCILIHAEYDRKEWQEGIAVAEKHAIEVNTLVPITSDRQHQEYVSVLDSWQAKNPTNEGHQGLGALLFLIEAYEEKHHPIPDASPVEVFRATNGGQ